MGLGVDCGSALVLNGKRQNYGDVVASGLASQYSWGGFILPTVDFDTQSQERMNERFDV